MTLEMLTEFFKWNTIINVCLLLFSFGMCALFRGLVYKIHGKIFKLSEDKLNEVLYMLLGLYKILIIIFNVIPYFVLVMIK